MTKIDGTSVLTQLLVCGLENFMPSTFVAQCTSCDKNTLSAPLFKNQVN